MEETMLPIGPDTDRNVYKALRGNVSIAEIHWKLTSGAEGLRALYADSDTTESVSHLIQQINFALRSYNSFHEVQVARMEGRKLSEKHVSAREQVPGQVYIDKVHAQVRWVWLALPIFLVLLTTVLLVATVRLSSNANVGIWKESPLALLLFGRYEGETRPIFPNGRDERQIRLVARDLTAQLTTNPDTSDEKLKSSVAIRRRSPKPEA